MTALHTRIRDDIARAILSGDLAPGTRIASEVELMAQYGCARMTVNKALSALAASGMLERRKRAGSFVAQPRSQSMVLDVPDLAAEVTARGQRYRWQLDQQRLVPDGDPAAAALGGSGAVLVLTGIHLADDQPLAHEHRLIASATVPEAAEVDFSTTPPGTWLLGHVPWTLAENRIAATLAPPTIARALGLTRPAPALSLTRRTWRGSDPVTWVRQLFPADSYELVARFGPSARG